MCGRSELRGSTRAAAPKWSGRCAPFRRCEGLRGRGFRRRRYGRRHHIEERIRRGSWRALGWAEKRCAPWDHVMDARRRARSRPPRGELHEARMAFPSRAPPGERRHGTIKVAASHIAPPGCARPVVASGDPHRGLAGSDGAHAPSHDSSLARPAPSAFCWSGAHIIFLVRCDRHGPRSRLHEGSTWRESVPEPQMLRAAWVIRKSGSALHRI